jgi:predicted amidohydrolase YtcJ
MTVLFRDVEVDGRRCDVRVDGDTLGAVDEALSGQDSDVIDGDGGALLPGLHDHHVHLLAMAAADRSVQLAGLLDDAALADALRTADQSLPRGAWLRAVGWHGPDLDRAILDAAVPDRPVRVQHRSGALWVLNSRALEAIGVDEPLGRLFRMDDVLRARIPADEPPDVAAAGRRLFSYGVTGVTDATPTERADDIALLARTGLDVLAMSAPTLPFDGNGPAKILLADHSLPALDDLVDQMRIARADSRRIAVHCVTAAALVLALAAWDAVGIEPGDRVEHGSVIPDDLVPVLAGNELTVVTQPNFVAERGDDYLAEVDTADQPFLYRCRSLLDAHVPVAFGTDAPFGDPDPWKAIAAATHRRTASGKSVLPKEAVDPQTALERFLSPAWAPGGPPRRVEHRAPADLVLLHAPLTDVLANPSADAVRMTMRAGEVVFGR